MSHRQTDAGRSRRDRSREHHFSALSPNRPTDGLMRARQTWVRPNVIPEIGRRARSFADAVTAFLDIRRYRAIAVR